MGIRHMIAPQGNHSSASALTVALQGSQADALAAAIADMTTTFSADLVSSSIGQRHNTYEHRSRVLREMRGALATMRARDAAEAPDVRK